MNTLIGTFYVSRCVCSFELVHTQRCVACEGSEPQGQTTKCFPIGRTGIVRCSRLVINTRLSPRSLRCYTFLSFSQLSPHPSLSISLFFSFTHLCTRSTRDWTCAHTFKRALLTQNESLHLCTRVRMRQSCVCVWEREREKDKIKRNVHAHRPIYISFSYTLEFTCVLYQN